MTSPTGRPPKKRRELIKPIFKSAGFLCAEWTNYREYMRDMKERDLEERWAMAFGKKKGARK